jgi:hypothetical protein
VRLTDGIRRSAHTQTAWLHDHTSAPHAQYAEPKNHSSRCDRFTLCYPCVRFVRPDWSSMGLSMRVLVREGQSYFGVGGAHHLPAVSRGRRHRRSHPRAGRRRAGRVGSGAVPGYGATERARLLDIRQKRVRRRSPWVAAHGRQYGRMEVVLILSLFAAVALTLFTPAVRGMSR